MVRVRYRSRTPHLDQHPHDIQQGQLATPRSRAGNRDLQVLAELCGRTVQLAEGGAFQTEVGPCAFPQKATGENSAAPEGEGGLLVST